MLPAERPSFSIYYGSFVVVAFCNHHQRGVPFVFVIDIVHFILRSYDPPNQSINPDLRRKPVISDVKYLQRAALHAAQIAV